MRTPRTMSTRNWTAVKETYGMPFAVRNSRIQSRQSARAHSTASLNLKRKLRESEQNIFHDIENARERLVRFLLQQPVQTDDQLTDEIIREMNRDELREAAERVRVCEPSVNAVLSAGLDGVKGGAA